LCDREGLLTGRILADRVINDVWLQTQKQMPEPEHDPDFVFLKRYDPPSPNVTIRFAPRFTGKPSTSATEKTGFARCDVLTVSPRKSLRLLFVGVTNARKAAVSPRSVYFVS
jgi:hypothetical protein